MSNNSQNIMDEFKTASGNASVKADRKLKVGIIGTGWIAGAHALELKKMEDVEITCLADLIPGKAEEFAKKWDLEGVRCYLSHKELLDNEELDAVSIATYNTTHAECSIYAIE